MQRCVARPADPRHRDHRARPGDRRRRPQREPGGGRRPEDPRLRRRGRRPLHGVPVGRPRQTGIPLRARDADHHALRRHQPGAPRPQCPGGDRTQLTFFPDRVGGASYEPRTRRLLPLRQGHGRRRVLASSTATTWPPAPHPAHRRRRSQNGGVRWSQQGRPHRLRVHPPQRAGPRRLRDGPARSADATGSSCRGRGRRLVRAATGRPDDTKLLVGRGHLRQRELPLARRRRRPATQDAADARRRAEKVAYSGAVVRAATARASTPRTDRGAEFQRLARIDLATGQHTSLTAHIDWDVDDFDLSTDGRRSPSSPTRTASPCCTCSTRPRARRSRRRSSASGRRHRRRRMARERPRPGLHVRLRAHARPTSIRLDVATGKVERWTESETGGLDAAGFSEPELVRWKSFDGRTISGFLYKPPRALHRAAAGDRQHPRRARRPVPARLPGALELLPRTSWAWPSCSRTCAGPRATARPS